MATRWGNRCGALVFGGRPQLKHSLPMRLPLLPTIPHDSVVWEELLSAATSKPKAPNYRVLEDPMTTAMYDPSTSSEAVPAPVASSSRPPASEVLEGAREKFDKFWGSKTRNTGTSDSASTTNNEP